MSELQKYYAAKLWKRPKNGAFDHVVYKDFQADAHFAAEIAELKRQHVEELAKMAGDQLARDADMYNLAEENRRLKQQLENARYERDSLKLTFEPDRHESSK